MRHGFESGQTFAAHGRVGVNQRVLPFAIYQSISFYYIAASDLPFAAHYHHDAAQRACPASLSAGHVKSPVSVFGMSGSRMNQD